MDKRVLYGAGLGTVLGALLGGPVGLALGLLVGSVAGAASASARPYQQPTDQELISAIMRGTAPSTPEISKPEMDHLYDQWVKLGEGRPATLDAYVAQRIAANVKALAAKTKGELEEVRRAAVEGASSLKATGALADLFAEVEQRAAERIKALAP